MSALARYVYEIARHEHVVSIDGRLYIVVGPLFGGQDAADPLRTVSAMATTSCSSRRNMASGSRRPEAMDASANDEAITSISPSSGGRPAMAKITNASKHWRLTVALFAAASIMAMVTVGSLILRPSTESRCAVEDRP